MKLRRRREEKEKHCHCVLFPSPSQAAAIAPLSSPSSLHHFTLSLHPSPPARILRRPSLSAAPGREINILQLSILPSCSASPFLLHKITETAERGGKDRGGRPACRPSCNRARPARRHPCSFIQSGGYRFSPVLMASSLWRVEP